MKQIILCLVVVMTGYTAIAQDFSYSQFQEAPLLRNPALAGVFEGDIRVTGVFRNQWQSITVPYKTGSASVEVKFPMGNSDDWLTVGLQTTLDQAGDIKLKRTQLLPVVNFHKSLSGDDDTYLSLAFMGGPVSNQFDPTQLKMGDQWVNGSFNPANPTAQVFKSTGNNYWDLSTGISYSSSWGQDNHYYLGIGLFHVTKPKVAFYDNNSQSRLARKMAFNAGVSMPTSDANKFELYADYLNQGGNSTFIGGGLYVSKLVDDYDAEKGISLSFGAFYRYNDALIPVVKMDVYRIAFGFSYDINVSRLNAASSWRGGLECSINYTATLNNRSAYADKMKCVRF